MADVVGPRDSSTPLDRALAGGTRSAYKGRRLNQEYLHHRTGIKVATIQRLMAGKSQFSVHQLSSLAEAIGGKTAPEYLEEAIRFMAEQA